MMADRVWKLFSIRLWMSLTILGFALGVLLFVGIITGLRSGNQPELLPEAICGALFGLVLGVCQWIALNRRLPRAGWWILLNVLGFAVGWPLGVWVSDFIPLPTIRWPGQTASMWHPLSAGIQGALTGAAIGLPAALILSIQFLRRRPVRWLLYCTLAWLMSVGVAAAIADWATGLIGSLLVAALIQGWVSALGMCELVGE